MGASTSTPKKPIFTGGVAPGMGKGANVYPNPSNVPTYKSPNINWSQLAQADMLADRPNQSTPWARSNWSQNSNGVWQQNVALSPQMQTLNNQYAGNATGANNGQAQALAQYFNLANGREYADVMSGKSLPSWDLAKAQLGMKSDPSTRLQVQSALMGLADPYNKAARSQLQSQLTAQGIDPNSEYAKRQNMQLSDNENRQLFEAINRGGEEEQRSLAMKMAAGQYNIDNTAKIRQGMLSDMFSRLQNPLDNAGRLGNIASQNMQGLQNIQQLSMMPAFAQVGGANTRAGENQLAAYQAKYGGDMDKYRAQVDRYNANQNAIANAWKLAYDRSSIQNAGAASTNQGISTGVGAASGIAMAAIIA